MFWLISVSNPMSASKSRGKEEIEVPLKCLAFFLESSRYTCLVYFLPFCSLLNTAVWLYTSLNCVWMRRFNSCLGVQAVETATRGIQTVDVIPQGIQTERIQSPKLQTEDTTKTVTLSIVCQQQHQSTMTDPEMRTQGTATDPPMIDVGLNTDVRNVHEK